MPIVSNTSPLNYLLLVGEVDLLPRPYPEIYTPNIVLMELAAPDSPEVVRRWAQSSPPWLLVRDPSKVLTGFAQ